MPYLNHELLDRVSADDFRNRPPFPWTHIENSLTPEGYETLRSTLPGTDAEGFNRNVGVKRAHGQMSHDRYMLHYRAGLKLPDPWREFLDELNGPEYHKFLRRMLGPRNYICTFSWQEGQVTSLFKYFCFTRRMWPWEHCSSYLAVGFSPARGRAA